MITIAPGGKILYHILDFVVALILICTSISRYVRVDYIIDIIKRKETQYGLVRGEENEFELVRPSSGSGAFDIKVHHLLIICWLEDIKQRQHTRCSDSS